VTKYLHDIKLREKVVKDLLNCTHRWVSKGTDRKHMTFNRKYMSSLYDLNLYVKMYLREVYGFQYEEEVDSIWKPYADNVKDVFDE
jgi:hypothetical protein